MWPNPRETEDLVTFTVEILNGKLHFLCSVYFNWISATKFSTVWVWFMIIAEKWPKWEKTMMKKKMPNTYLYGNYLVATEGTQHEDSYNWSRMCIINFSKNKHACVILIQIIFYLLPSKLILKADLILQIKKCRSKNPSYQRLKTSLL